VVVGHDPFVAAVALEVGGGGDAVTAHGHEGLSLDHPVVDDVLGRVSLQLGQQGGGGHGPAGDDGGDVGVDQLRELIPVGAGKRAKFMHG
jgi:hypothetical protein